MGSYSERSDLYPATKVDLAVISYVAAYPFVRHNDPTFAADAQSGIVFLFLPGSIIDLPFAIALDTVMLPYDIHNSSKPIESATDDRNRSHISSNSRLKPLVSASASETDEQSKDDKDLGTAR